MNKDLEQWLADPRWPRVPAAAPKAAPSRPPASSVPPLPSSSPAVASSPRYFKMPSSLPSSMSSSLPSSMSASLPPVTDSISQGGPHLSFPYEPPASPYTLPPTEPILGRTTTSLRTEPVMNFGSPEPYQMQVKGLRKAFRKGGVEIPVLKGVDLGIARGEFVTIVGQSGSGKSTLLHLMGTLDSPDDGQISFEGKRIDSLPGRERDILRNRYLGLIFQFYHLLPELTVLENVLAPLMIAQRAWRYFRNRRANRQRAEELLDLVGLGHRLKHRPRELSGGEMQRAAIARALVTQPNLLLADEPTGNLDQKTGREILEILRSLNRQQNLTIVMVTHDLTIAGLADRVVRLVDGQVEMGRK